MMTYIKKKDIIDPKKEQEALVKQKDMLEKELKRSETILNNSNFVQKAPKEKLDLEKEKYQSYQKQYDSVIKKLKDYV
jgi:valyl-tRNA synthetase